MRLAVAVSIIFVGVSVAIFIEFKLGGVNLASEVRQVSEVCETSEDRFACYDVQITALSERHTTKRILSVLEEDTSQEIVQDCHAFTHALGHRVYREADSFVSSFSSCTDYCFSGCYHGIAEEHFSQILQGEASVHEEIVTDIDTFFERCSSEKESARCWKEFGDALHGLGHAFMFISGNNVPESLGRCDGVSPQGTARACYDGVFMSNNEALLENGADSEFAKHSDPLFPCSTLAKRYQSTCYKSAAEYRLSESPEENIALCKKFPENEQRYCFEQVARLQVVNITDLTLLAPVCEKLDAQYQEYCVRGTARYLTDKYGEEEKNKFCNTLSAPLRAHCVQ